MKRYLVGLILALALVFAVGSTTMAAPLAVGEAGSFVVYGEYGPGFLSATFTVGAGYAISEGFAIGAFVQPETGLPMAYGAFACLSLGPIAINADLATFSGFPGFYGTARALYMFDLDPLKIGVGGSMYYISGLGSAFLVSGAVSFSADAFSIYGYVDYSIDTGAIGFEAGVSLSF